MRLHGKSSASAAFVGSAVRMGCFCGWSIKVRIACEAIVRARLREGDRNGYTTPVGCECSVEGSHERADEAGSFTPTPLLAAARGLGCRQRLDDPTDNLDAAQAPRSGLPVMTKAAAVRLAGPSGTDVQGRD
jgi:hypothetical protein